jgi:hypothetical protein
MFFLLVIWGDCQPEIKGPYASDVERLALARRHRVRSGDRDGLFRLDVHPFAKPGECVDVRPFAGGELEPAAEVRFKRRSPFGRRFIPA